MRAAYLLLPFLLACPPKEEETGGAHTGDTSPDTAAAERDPRFDDFAALIETTLADSTAPGVAVALIEDGQLVFAEGFGFRSASSKEPVNANTTFRIASVTKGLTAIGLLQKAQDARIDLDAAITDVMPEFDFYADDSWADSITGAHLLTHQSGMYDYLEIEAATDDDDLEAYLTTIFDRYLWLMNPAGAFYNYSNPNYSVAGLAIEMAEDRGKDGEAPARYYPQVLAEDVFGPLGMTRTAFYGDEVIENGNYAVGLSYDWTGVSTGSVDAAPDSYDSAWCRPAGYAWSSVVDLAEYVKFLLLGNEDVLSEAYRTAMIDGQVDTEEFLEYSHYGYGVAVSDGWFLDSTWTEDRLLNHSGAIPGFSAIWYALPSTNDAVIILANTDAAYFGEVAVAALEFFEVTTSTAPDFTVDTSTFGELEGTYEDPWNVGDIVISVDGDDLKISMPTLDMLDYLYDETLQPYVTDNFVLTLNDYAFLVTFIRDEDGAPKYFRTRYFVGTLPDEDEPKALQGARSPSERTLAERKAVVDGWLRDQAMNPEMDPARPFERLHGKK